MLRKGKNAAAVVLADGWFRGEFGFRKDWYLYGKKLALLYQLEIELENGQKHLILSDNTWKNNIGPILSASIFDGMVYDANKEIENWNLADFDDSMWTNVSAEQIPMNHIVHNLGEPVKRIEELAVIKEIITPSKERVFDFGQNLTGRVRFQLAANKGDSITILHSEVLDKSGNFYTDNLRSAKQRIKYIFKDNKPVIFEPEFTFQGFRYIKVTDYKGQLKPDNFKAVVIHSDMEPTGQFACSDSLVNKLHSNIRWGMRGNFLEIPTDCPQRDERLGWTGDVQVFSSTANFFYNTGSFFRKWLEDLKADQLPNGSVPHVVPAVFKEYGSTGWGDVATVLPFNMFLSTGDRQFLENQYNSMKSWVDYLASQAEKNFILRKNSKYADWLFFIHPTDWNAKPGFTDKDFVATAYFAYSTSLLAKAATILGKKQDALKYNTLFQNIKQAFQHEYLTSSGRLSSNSQTAYAMAIQFKLLPDSLVKKAVEYLKQDIIDRKYHLSTGFLGTPLLCHALSENGENDIAYKLLLQKTYPSWLYPITKGATTIWERWDGIKPDGTFQTSSMNSFNHYAYGAIGSWMYSKMAGIQTDSVHSGYKHIVLKPMPDSSIKWVKCSYSTPYGDVLVNWSFTDEKLKLSTIIPVNTTASIYLPFTSEVKKMGSGKYEFEIPVNLNKK